MGACHHRHRVDKYLDTLLANQPISGGEATDHCQKVCAARWRTARVNSSPILPNQSQQSSFAVIGYAEAGHCRKSPMTSLTCRLVEDLNFGMQNLRPSNIKVIFQRPSCGSPNSGGFRFHCRYCPCACHCRSISPVSQHGTQQQTRRTPR